jgi:putative ABC transport system ATP-binding protein
MVYNLQSISRTYWRGPAAVKALEDVSFQIIEGEFVALTGPSGSGKSTLLHVMGLLDPEFSGRLSVAGRSVAGLSSSALAQLRLEEIGFVFQGFHLIPTMKIVDNVALPLWRLHGNKRAARYRSEELLTRMGLGNRLSHRAKELSGGEMQRVAVARALINDPRIVLADEPTANLDEENTRIIIDLFKTIRSLRKTIVVISHDPQVLAAADRVIVLCHGQVAEIRSQHAESQCVKKKCAL